MSILSNCLPAAGTSFTDLAIAPVAPAANAARMPDSVKVGSPDAQTIGLGRSKAPIRVRSRMPQSPRG
jgi:hypothetical protein